MAKKYQLLHEAPQQPFYMFPRQVGSIIRQNIF